MCLVKVYGPGRTYSAALAAQGTHVFAYYRSLHNVLTDESLRPAGTECQGCGLRQSEMVHPGDRAVDGDRVVGKTEVSGDFVGEEFTRFDPEHAAYGCIHGNGVGAGEDGAHVGRAAPFSGAVALHRQYSVDDRDRRADGVIDFHQELGKHLPVHAGFHMPFRFSKTHHTSEHILHSEGQEHLAVRFEFCQVDDDIRLQGLCRNFDGAERFADIDGHGIFEFPEVDGKVAEGRPDPAFPHYPVEGTQCRAVRY